MAKRLSRVAQFGSEKVLLEDVWSLHHSTTFGNPSDVTEDDICIYNFIHTNLRILFPT